MAEETVGQVLPTSTGFAAKQAVAFLREHNVAAASLLQRADLSERHFDKRPRRILAATQSKLLEYASEALEDSAFGLHLAQSNPREAGLLFYVASAAKSIGEALTLYARYSRIVNEAVRVKLVHAQNGVVVEFHFVGVSRHRVRQNAEFGIAAIVKGLREVAGRNIHPTRVTFAHERNSNLRQFERFFGCPVDFGGSIDQLSFSNETLALPPAHHRRPVSLGYAPALSLRGREGAQHA